MLRAVLRPLTTSADLDQRVEVRLNDRVLAERPLAGEITLALPVPAPYHAALPNVLTLTHRYRRPPLARNEDYRIGATGVGAPGDLVVRSSGDPQARTGSITLDDVELSPDRRGYNLVALSPAGVVLSAARFDTFRKPTASQHLASWIGALPAGTIVAGAVRDEASGLLDERAVAALRTLGVRGDLRGRFRAAHAFVGVKGAPPGTAAEQAGAATAVVTIGHPHPDRGIELTAFDLAPAAASP
ncbi:MAG: hypothetical protein DMD79_23905 [Candidatus Rokuibacteriota bacterium]|nr:MAG: hypothetical protein DMD79_23905 [Candidatus Rokubacteria bacterium]